MLGGVLVHRRFGDSICDSPHSIRYPIGRPVGWAGLQTQGQDIILSKFFAIYLIRGF